LRDEVTGQPSVRRSHRASVEGDVGLQFDAMAGRRHDTSSASPAGSCTFSIPELLFDLDFPGHYRRRIKSVSLTIPCVVGPYTNVNAKLTLLHSRIRHSSDATRGYAATESDSRFTIDPTQSQSIATSTAQRDSGMFELTFRDDRFLPFEGAGAISQWQLELPGPVPQFDYDSISDVILHVSYTAKEDHDRVEPARAHVERALDRWLADGGIPRLINVRNELSAALHAFLHPVSSQTTHQLAFTLEDRHFPLLLRAPLRAGRVTVRTAYVVVEPRASTAATHFAGVPLALERAAGGAQTGLLAVDTVSPESPRPPAWGGLPVAGFDAPATTWTATGSWSVELNSAALATELTHEVDGRRRLRPDVVDNVYLLLVLEVRPRPVQYFRCSVARLFVSAH
jgi:hypothetical protein